jgi:hypothetical protein
MMKGCGSKQSWHFPEAAEENYEKPGVRAEI